MTDEITRDDLDAFIRAIGFPRVTPALPGRVRQLVATAVTHIPDMSGPGRKRISDAMAVQTRALAAALEMAIDIPERDLVVLSRP